jgi:hypothetical protein
VPAPPGDGGGGFGGGGGTAGPFVLGGSYSVELIVDGKTVDKKPLKVTDDPDVILTQAERRHQFDMAMEMHALQPRANEAAAAFGNLTRQITELGTTIAGRTDVPADVKSSFDAFKTELTAMAPRLTTPQGRGGGGGGRGNSDAIVAKIGQAKNGLMGGMSVGEQTTRAYAEAKALTPKTITELNALIVKAGTLSTALARANLTLTVPQPVKMPEAAPVRKTNGAK